MIVFGTFAQECLTTVECSTFVNRYPLFYYLQSSNCVLNDSLCITQCMNVECPYPSFGSPYVSDYQYRRIQEDVLPSLPVIASNSSNCNRLGEEIKEELQFLL